MREEVLYREALALGLDRDDAVMRRLMRQKYEFLTQDLAVPAEPSPAELAAWYEGHPERYRTPQRLSFTQVWFDVDRRGPAGEREATYQQRRQANDAIYARLLQRYEFVLEQPADTAILPGP